MTAKLAAALGLVALLALPTWAQGWYEEDCPQAVPLYPFEANGKWGLLAQDGKVQVAPKFLFVGPFKDDMAQVQLEDYRLAFINSEGRVAFTPEIDKQQNVQLEFSEGLVAAKQDGKWGYLDKQGNWVITPRYAYARPFHDGMASVRFFEDEGNAKLIDKRGSIVLQVIARGRHYGSTFVFREGKAVHNARISLENWGFGYIDVTGDWLILPQFELVQDFYEGLAAVQTHETKKWGFIDSTGRFRITARYDAAGRFRDGLAPVRLNGASGFIDKAGNLSIPPRFEQASGFCAGLAPIKLNGLWGYVDKKGDIAIRPQFCTAGDFAGELSRVSISAENGTFRDQYIDRRGNVVWSSATTWSPIDNLDVSSGCWSAEAASKALGYIPE